MQISKNSIISAQVILRPASGKTIDDRVVISAENVAEFAPSPSVVSSVTIEFGSNGFEIGPLIGISFSITGTIHTFEKFFGMRIKLGKDNGFEFVKKNKTSNHELYGYELPDILCKSIHTIVFPLPPDFGLTKV